LLWERGVDQWRAQKKKGTQCWGSGDASLGLKLKKESREVVTTGRGRGGERSQEKNKGNAFGSYWQTRVGLGPEARGTNS